MSFLWQKEVYSLAPIPNPFPLKCLIMLTDASGTRHHFPKKGYLNISVYKMSEDLINLLYIVFWFSRSVVGVGELGGYFKWLCLRIRTL